MPENGIKVRPGLVPLRADQGGGWALGLALVIMVLLAWPNVVATSRESSGALAWTDVSALGLQFWLFWFALFGRVGWGLLLATPFALLWPLEMWVRTVYNSPITAHFAALAFESNPGELADLMSVLRWQSALLLAWVALYVLALILAWRHRVVVLGPIRWLVLAAMAGLALFSVLTMDRGGWLVEGDASQRLGPQARQGWSEQWTHVFPLNQLIAWQVYRRDQADMLHFREALAQRRLNAVLVSADAAADTVVLVIGESSTASRWSLFGYYRPTTPRLQSLDLAIFSDVAALSSATRSAVPGVLARRPLVMPNGELDPGAEPSLVRAFSEAGYATFWLSNQGATGFGDSSIAIYAHEAQRVRFLNPASYAHRGNLDDVLLPELDAALAGTGRKLIVLHTLGSHFDFAARYPAEFDHFQPSTRSKSGAAEAGLADRIGNSYDNSVLYSDYVLSEVVRRVNVRPGRAVVAYFSDHGSDLHGTSCGRVSQVSRVGYSTFHVPVWFWLNDALKQANPEAWRTLQANRDQPYTTRAVYAALMGLSGVTVPELVQAESFLQKPVMRPSRIFGGQDFDALRKAGCP